MDLKTHALVTAIIFLAAFILHGLRLFYGWEVVIGGFEVPTWLSWIFLVVSGYLAYTGFVASGVVPKK